MLKSLLLLWTGIVNRFGPEVLRYLDTHPAAHEKVRFFLGLNIAVRKFGVKLLQSSTACCSACLLAMTGIVAVSENHFQVEFANEETE